jgi:hypothetical protein
MSGGFQTAASKASIGALVETAQTWPTNDLRKRSSAHWRPPLLGFVAAFGFRHGVFIRRSCFLMLRFHGITMGAQQEQDCESNKSVRRLTQTPLQR